MKIAPHIVAFGLLLCSFCCAQQASPATKTQVKINYLNVCTPSADDQTALNAALDRLPLHPGFTPDFEVSRGRTTPNTDELKIAGAADIPEQKGPSNWVRMRRDFPSQAQFVSTEYSISVDEKNITETLVFRSRELKDVIETLLEDTVSAAANPAQVLQSDTPVDRIRIERFGKTSVVLAQCPGADQSAYQPLFTKASSIMARYRSLLRVRQTAPADLRRLGVGAPAAPVHKVKKKPLKKSP